MEQFIFSELTKSERQVKLRKISRGKERVTYMRNLTEAEIDTESKKLAQLCQRRNELEEEKKNVAKDYQTQIDSVKKDIDKSASVLNEGRKEQVEDCYKVINIETREVGFYNEQGELVKKRVAYDADLQLDMFEQQHEEEQKRNEETRKALEAANRLSAGGDPDDYEEAQIVTDKDSDQDSGQEEQSEQCTDEDENSPESEENAPDAEDIA